MPWTAVRNLSQMKHRVIILLPESMNRKRKLLGITDSEQSVLVRENESFHFCEFHGLS
jgi:hypothetical protein